MQQIYLTPQVLPSTLVGRTVDRPALGAAELAAEVGRFYEALRCADRALEAEVRLHLLLDAIAADLGPG